MPLTNDPETIGRLIFWATVAEFGQRLFNEMSKLPLNTSAIEVQQAAIDAAEGFDGLADPTDLPWCLRSENRDDFARICRIIGRSSSQQGFHHG